jgi:hypothetical protein
MAPASMIASFDAGTIASLATAGGTLVLAIATFSATRSANRAARVSEQALKVGLRPVLFNARPQDPPQKVGFVDDHWLGLRDGLAAVQCFEEKLYLAIPLRNVGAGLAVLHGWSIWNERALGATPPRPLGEFRLLQRDLYVPAGDISFWQAAIRDASDPLYAPLRESAHSGKGISVDILYGDHEGGQRTITRFYLTPRAQGVNARASASEQEPWLWVCSTARHWNIDQADPRLRPEALNG